MWQALQDFSDGSRAAHEAATASGVFNIYLKTPVINHVCLSTWVENRPADQYYSGADIYSASQLMWWSQRLGHLPLATWPPCHAHPLGSAYIRYIAWNVPR